MDMISIAMLICGLVLMATAAHPGLWRASATKPARMLVTHVQRPQSPVHRQPASAARASQSTTIDPRRASSQPEDAVGDATTASGSVATAMNHVSLAAATPQGMAVSCGTICISDAGWAESPRTEA